LIHGHDETSKFFERDEIMIRWKNPIAGLVILSAVFFVGREWGRAEEEKKAQEKVYELRVYLTNDGKLDDLHKRFRDHTTKLFEKHGIENIGYWVPIPKKHDEPTNAEANTLIYIVAHKSMDAARQSWKAFGEDPEWRRVFSESHKNGVIVKKVESTYMKAVDYSKLK
jgi:hypothetical protein